MWTWLQDSAQVINALAAVLMLVVWVLYFQLLYGQYQHRLRAKILINRRGGTGLNARCIISNMSAEPIYIEEILMVLAPRVGGEKEKIVALENSEDERQIWQQGPLKSGDMVDIATFGDLVSAGLAACGPEMQIEDLRSFKLIVVATYTAEDRLVAAERAFDMLQGDLHPRSYTARQVRSHAQRRKLEKLVQHLER